MPETQIDLNDMAKYGVVHDSPAHEIPPEAWTLGENVRFIDDSIGTMDGIAQIFDDPEVAPYKLQYISTVGSPFWIYLGLQKAFVWDGSIYSNITRQSGGVDQNYNATSSADWNTTILGGIPIQNNGIDVPQYWSDLNPGVPLANIPNWTSGMRAKVVRAFGPYLMALNITIGGQAKPHNVRWSSEADPGTLPNSWDIADPTQNAGEVTLPDVESGLIQDGLPLQGKFYVYKESSCWRFRNIGGRFIFDEDAFLETIGLFTTRCVAITGDGQKHFFVSQDNIYVHDGNVATPLLNKTFKRYLFKQINVGAYKESFVFVDPLWNEGWFCYPGLGSDTPNRACVVNYNTMAVTECDIEFQDAVIGTIETPLRDANGNAYLWSTAIGGWADNLMGGPDGSGSGGSGWSIRQKRKIAVARPTGTPKILQLDANVPTRDGVAFTSTVQRHTLGVVGRNRKTGEWIEDFEVRKLITRVWPKMSGGPVTIRLGGQNIPGGAVAWSDPVVFDPTLQKWCDIMTEGATVAIEVSSQHAWKLDGYKLDMVTLGRF